MASIITVDDIIVNAGGSFELCCFIFSTIWSKIESSELSSHQRHEITAELKLVSTDLYVVAVYDESGDSDAFSGVLTLLCNQSPSVGDGVPTTLEEQAVDGADSGYQP